MLLSTTSLTKAGAKTPVGGTRRDSAPQIFGTCLLFYSAARPGGERYVRTASCRRASQHFEHRHQNRRRQGGRTSLLVSLFEQQSQSNCSARLVRQLRR